MPLKNNDQGESDRCLNLAQRGSPGGNAGQENFHQNYDDDSGRQIVRFEPSSLLKEGNSDPFSAFAIPVDAKVNYLMKFCRDVFLPDISRDINNTQGKGSQRDWSECILYLQDECCAYAHLTRVVTVVPPS